MSCVSFLFSKRVNKKEMECSGKEIEIKQKRLKKVVNISWIWIITKKYKGHMWWKYEDEDVNKIF